MIVFFLRKNIKSEKWMILPLECKVTAIPFHVRLSVEEVDDESVMAQRYSPHNIYKVIL